MVNKNWPALPSSERIGIDGSRCVNKNKILISKMVCKILLEGRTTEAQFANWNFKNFNKYILFSKAQ